MALAARITRGVVVFMRLWILEFHARAVRAEGNGGKTRAVEQGGFGVCLSYAADVFRPGNKGRRNDDGGTIDSRVRPDPLAVITTNGKLPELVAFRGEATVGVSEVKFPRSCNGFESLQFRPVERNLLSVMDPAGSGQPQIRAGFTRCMTIWSPSTGLTKGFPA